jgi:signal transduction histidine kinase/ActR/RegA family two-component response regulator
MDTAPMRQKPLLLQLEEMPLRQQMLLVFSVVMLVFTGLLALFVDHQITESAVQGRGQQTAQDSAFFANLIDADIEGHLIDIRVRAQNFHNAGWHKDLRGFQTTITRLQDAQSHYAWIGYADQNGQVVAATRNMLVGAQVGQRPWFREAMQGPTVIDVHAAQLLADLLPRPDHTEHLRFVDLAAPVHDDQDRFIGVLAAHLSVDWLSERIKSFARSRFTSELVRPAVIGADGAFRFGDPGSVVGLDTRRIWAAAEAQGHGWMVVTPKDGQRKVVGFAKHHGPGGVDQVQWVSVIPLQVSSIVGELQTTRALAMGGVAVVSLIAWGTLFLLLHLAGRPVRQLMQLVRQAQTSREPLPPMDGLPEEFGEVQTTVNNFLLSLKAREAELQTALDELRDSFTDVTDAFPGVLFRLESQPDGQAEFTYLSPSATHYLHVEAQAMPLSALALFLREDVSQPTDMSEVLLRQLAAAQPLDLTFAITGLDGVRRHMRIKGHLRGKGRGRRIWQGVIVDVSDLVAAQIAASEADQAKSRFLATMSHELRTPLNGILGFAQLLQQTVDSESQRADLRKIIDTTEVLTRILNDILDFSRIEEGQLLLETRPFSIEELVESSASLFHVEAQRRQLDFIVNVNSPGGVRALGDPTRLKQVVNNLLSNAMKFTSQGHVRLEVSCEPQSAQQALLQLRVSDTGIGMSAESLNKLFHRFQQGDDTIFRRFGGSGLGLAIVKGIVEAMGGSIAVDSQPGVGTVFVVEVPLRLMSAASVAPRAADNEALAPLQVLVVDDVAMNRELIVRMLQAGGHTVHEAADGQQALAMAEKTRYDIILMDINMPVMDGLEAARLIRSRPGASCASTIIALTGHAFDNDIVNARAAGIDDHLAKPVVFGKLKETIRASLNARAKPP